MKNVCMYVCDKNGARASCIHMPSDSQERKIITLDAAIKGVRFNELLTFHIFELPV